LSNKTKVVLFIGLKKNCKVNKALFVSKRKREDGLPFDDKNPLMLTLRWPQYKM
jgi:hypothetical protein